MQLDALHDHLKRIDRDFVRARRREGEKWVNEVDVEDGRRVRYIMNGLRPIEDIDDEVRHALVDLWSLKDYVKEELRKRGTDPEDVERWVNSRWAVARCADLANLHKHGKLTRSRSRIWPTFGKSKYEVRSKRKRTGARIGKGIQRITFRENEVEMDIVNPEDERWVTYELPVLDRDGDVVGEACITMVAAHEDWVNFLTLNSIPLPSPLRSLV